MSEQPWREWPEYKRLDEIVGHDPLLDDLCAGVWREAFGRGMNEGQRWANKARNIERAEAAIERVDRLARALLGLVTMIDRHREVYGHEKAHYVMDENAEWREARAALADSPKGENDG